MLHRFWCFVYLTHPVIFFFGMKGYLGKRAEESAKKLESKPKSTALLLVVMTLAYTVITYWIARKLGLIQ